MYHYIKNTPKHYEQRIKHLKLEQFIEQINYFIKNYEIIDLSDLEDTNLLKRSKKQKVLLTFDDGYKDMIVNVAPILNKLKLKGTFFLIGSVLKEKKIPLVNKIHLLLSQVNDTDKILELIRYKYNKFIEEKIFNVSELVSFDIIYQKLAIKGRFDDEKTMFIKKFFQNYLDEIIANHLLEQIYYKLHCVNLEEIFDDYFLSIKDIQEMADYGFSFGYHGYKHFHYGLKSYDEQKDDLMKTITVFKDLNIYNKYSSFCYPYGSYNPNTLNLLLEFGINYAFTCEVRDFNQNSDSRLLIPRYDTNDFIKLS